MKQRTHLTAELKVLVLRELLENNVPISQLAVKHNIHPNDIYNWRKKLFETAPATFSQTQKKNADSAKDKTIASLENKLKKRDEAISFLLRENIEIKWDIPLAGKSLGGEI
jgi:transposase